MIQLLFSLLALCSCQLLLAQNSGQRIKENAKWKIENKVNEKVDKDSDRVEFYWISSDWNRWKKPEWKPKAYARFNQETAREYPSQIL